MRLSNTAMTGEPIDRKRELARERTRRWRQRCNQGRVAVTVEVGEPIVDALISVGWLSSLGEADRKNLQSALQELLDKFANSLA
jgi:hypothetical protein